MCKTTSSIRSNYIKPIQGLQHTYTLLHEAVENNFKELQPDSGPKLKTVLKLRECNSLHINRTLKALITVWQQERKKEANLLSFT